MVAPTDWISAYSFMSKKILPYMKQFQKHEKWGMPSNLMMDESISEEMKKLGYTWDASCASWKGDQTGLNADDYLAAKWDEIINEIVFALEYTANDEPADDCLVPNMKYNPDQKEPFQTIPCEGKEGYSQLIFNEDYGSTKTDMALLRKKEERVANGYRLMGIYWQSLWD
jgi:hypothetical protein